MFIVIEGTDASGKNTQIWRLAQRFESLHNQVSVFSFPRYGTPLGKLISRHLKQEVVLSDQGNRAPEDALMFQCLMAADKYDAAPEIIARLAEGKVVLCDRWWPSAYAYGAADGLDKVWLVNAHKLLPEPDLMVFLDVPPAEALKRRPETRDRYEADREKQGLVRGQYQDLWTRMRTMKRGWTIVDGLGTEEDVHARIWAQVNARKSQD